MPRYERSGQESLDDGLCEKCMSYRPEQLCSACAYCATCCECKDTACRKCRAQNPRDVCKTCVYCSACCLCHNKSGDKSDRKHADQQQQQ
ncbi:hypothetical protein BGX33_002723 [Mortierella sp. NVP41]|nr:hypothetical protein BGX33_002723 [Mortierella sp. NVP41]